MIVCFNNNTSTLLLIIIIGTSTITDDKYGHDVAVTQGNHLQIL